MSSDVFSFAISDASVVYPSFCYSRRKRTVHFSALSRMTVYSQHIISEKPIQIECMALPLENKKNDVCRIQY